MNNLLGGFGIVVVLAALGTWAERVLPWTWAIRAHAKQSRALSRLDPFVRAFAPAVVMALLLSSVWSAAPTETAWRVLAASAATVLASWRFRSMAVSIVVGMGSFWILHLL